MTKKFLKNIFKNKDLKSLTVLLKNLSGYSPHELQCNDVIRTTTVILDYYG